MANIYCFFGLSDIEEPLSDCDLSQIIEFKENGDLEVYFNDTSNCNFNTFTTFYTLENNTLTINYTDGLDSSTIVYSERNNVKTLNSTTLKYVEVWNSEDGDLPIESRSTYTLIRID